MKIILLLSSLVLSGSLVCTGSSRGDSERGERGKRTRNGHFPVAARDSDFIDNGAPSAAKVELGKNLMFDRILSGNMNISCATCHHPLSATSDGLSLPVGEGGIGVSVTRSADFDQENPVRERVPRNAPAVFNQGAKEFRVLFHDGRVEVDPSQPSGFRTPAGLQLPMGLENALAAQAMFPVTSAAEMAGHPGENAIADAGALELFAGPNGVWEQLAERLRQIPEYVEMFLQAYPEIRSATEITYVHAANAIAAFESVAWRADDSPFDRYLRREPTAMSSSARQGMTLFYGRAGCASCHKGTFQTDHEFHAIGVPQIGPGKGDGTDGHEDFGRERVTGNRGDRYAFRTPSLRNVALTGPWGHDGAFNSLEEMVRHHFDPAASMENYDPTQAVLPSHPDLDSLDFIVQNDPARRAAIVAASELKSKQISERDLHRLMDFLHSLTDFRSVDLRKDVPKRVPSGLPVFD